MSWPKQMWDASDFIGEGDQDGLPPGWGDNDDDEGADDFKEGTTRAPTPSEVENESRRQGSKGGVVHHQKRSVPLLFTNAPAPPSAERPPRPPPLASAARQRMPWSVLPESRSAPVSRSASRGSEPISVEADPGVQEVRAKLERLKAARRKGASLEETLGELEALQQRARDFAQPDAGLAPLGSKAAVAVAAASTASARAVARSEAVRYRCNAEAAMALSRPRPSSCEPKAGKVRRSSSSNESPRQAAARSPAVVARHSSCTDEIMQEEFKDIAAAARVAAVDACKVATEVECRGYQKGSLLPLRCQPRRRASSAPVAMRLPPISRT